jgi:uncharacterized oligopeptide transporter (OPT) family protein
MLMSFIVDGIMTQKLPWSLVLIGVFIAVLLELLGLSSLAFAVGVYLPIATSMPIMIGGVVRWIADRTARRKLTEAEATSGPGVLFSSGLIAGGSVTGMILALIQLRPAGERFVKAINLSEAIPTLSGSDLFSILLFLALATVLYLVATERFLAEKGR